MEWQTRLTQNQLPQGVWVRLPPFSLVPARSKERKPMNDFVLSIITRTNAVVCGAVGMGWIEMGYPKMAALMFLIGWIDPNWVEMIGKKKKETNNGNAKKRRSTTKRTS